MARQGKQNKKHPLLPNGLTAKQEIFCREISNGSNLTDAYHLAYDTSNMQQRSVTANATALKAQDKIIDRLEEIQQQKDWHARLSEEFVIGELVQNHYRAIDNNELANSNRTLELLGRNLNLWKEQPKAPEQLEALFAWLATDEETEEPPPAIGTTAKVLESPDGESTGTADEHNATEAS
jgi:hypothetical protein